MLEVPVLIISCKRNIDLLIKIVKENCNKLYIAVEHGHQPFTYIPQLGDMVKINSFNLGSQFGWLNALDWFFSNEEYGIILEDDVVPNKSFFKFMEIMLYKYQYLPRVWAINSTHYLKPSNTYFYTGFISMWGWATWRDRIEKWDIFLKKTQAPYRNRYFNKVIRNGYDYTFQGTIWNNQGVCVNPGKNLSTNIGIDEHSIHTKSDKLFKVFNLPTQEINFNNLEFDNKNYDTEICKIKYPNKLQKLKIYLDINKSNL